MPESINSLSPDFRDFLLNRNLITDTVTDNGLDALLVGIGVPYGGIGTPPEAVQASADIVGDGSLYKDLNLVTNKYQGDDDDYRLASITFNSAGSPPTSAFIYSSSYTDEQGVLNNTLNTPANGPFQGGDVRDFNTSKNLYDDESKRLLISLDDVLLPNVKYTNYIDLNSSIVNPAIDVLGSIFNGQGVGVSTTAIVPTFDLRASLVGRVLGGTGVIADTPIGQAGAKYLALALANNAAFGLQQETIGHLNLNPLNIAKNGLGGIVVPNYNITVPSGTLGRVVDFTSRVLGFESPFSLYARSSSIFTSENPISNIDRANAQLANTGKGQVLSLFANVKMNKFRPAYQDNRVRGGDTASDADKAQKGSALNPNLYAFGTTDGKIIDFLNNNVVVDENGVVDAGEGSDVNTPISQSNYNLDGLIEASGFNGVDEGLTNPLLRPGYGPDGLTKFSWGDVKDNKDALKTFTSDGFTSPNSILTKTQRLFNSGKMKTLVSGHYGTDNDHSEIQSSVAINKLISKGSAVLSSEVVNGAGSVDDDNVFCRTWTTFDRYDQVQDLQKSSGINTNTAFREGYVNGDSVLGDNGFVKIGPYIGDTAKGDIKNFMFSLENLAWADNIESLLDCEKGPGDPLTGKFGRIMWFPPYDLTVSENTSVNWESTNFIGRGEPIYTYSNTERTGTLQFKIVVDHPSYLNAIDSEDNDYIASFFAGCTEINSELAKKLTPLERDEIEVIKDGPKLKPIETATVTPEVPRVDFYFSNDNYEVNPLYEDGVDNGFGPAADGGLALTKGLKVVSITADEFPDNTDFGLNGKSGTSASVLVNLGNWISVAGQTKLKKVLNEDCQACKIKIKGFASTQGGSVSKNQTLSQLRADSIKAWFIDNGIIDGTQEIYTNKFTVDNRFIVVKGEGETGTGCPTIIEDGKRLQNQDIVECKQARKVSVAIEWDSELQSIIDGNDEIPLVPPKEKWRVSQRIINRFYNECNYFEKLRQQDKVVFDSLKEKLKFFHPAFHAITPEGLNSRLTFLQQCTRQGPTNIIDKPDNLAFGRPPVCILRLGDFYHTKIVIDNIGVTYEPLVWDLNPEGIGVQPMIATVDLSFKMIGGQSMKGPINKLQNAVSFNFFGNTQIYDVRADKIKIEKNPDGTDGKAILVPGDTVLKDVVEILDQENLGGIDGDGDETVAVDQEELANQEGQEEDETPIGNKEVVQNIQLDDAIYNTLSTDSTYIELKFRFDKTNNTTFKFTDSTVSATGIVFIVNSSDPKYKSVVGRVVINGDDDGLGVNIYDNSTYNTFLDENAIAFTSLLPLDGQTSDFFDAIIGVSTLYSIRVDWKLNEGKGLKGVHKNKANLTEY